MQIRFTADFREHHPLYPISNFQDTIPFVDRNAAIKWANDVNKNTKNDYRVKRIETLDGSWGYVPKG